MSTLRILHSKSAGHIPALLLPVTALLAILFFPGPKALAADKADTWIEVRSTHFRVISNGSEKQARRVAGQFERFREVLRNTLVKSRLDPSSPLLILAVKDEKSLKALLPEYWEKKNASHPAGIFLRSVGKDFVALRIDADFENQYQIIYHEYTHSLMALNFRSLPVWVGEGLAEFFGHATMGDKEAGVGRPSVDQLRLLREKNLLPLETLLTAQKDSPYYNETNKTSHFYAQSWALTHLLMIGDKGARQAQMLKYIALTSDGMPDLEAAQQAFGDVKQLEQKLADYIHQAAYFYLPVKMTEVPDEKAFALRNISEAEALAARGDFLMHNRRYTEALPMLQEALQLDPKLALVHESLGFYYYRKNDNAQAASHFGQAAELDPANFLAHYYFATLSSARINRENADMLEAHLRKSLELNPLFAPAYSALADVYSARGSKFEEALQLATKAIQLQPGELAFHIALANVLLRMERVDEAVYVTQRAARIAFNKEDRNMLSSFQAEIDSYKEYLAQKKRFEAEAAATAKQRKEEAARRDAEMKAESATKQREPSTTQKTGGSGNAPIGKPTAKSQAAYVVGKIKNVVCGNPAQIDLEVEIGGKTIRFHGNNYYKIEFFSLNWKPPDDFQPCEHIAGLNAKVTYNAVEGMLYAGEIISVEIRK